MLVLSRLLASSLFLAVALFAGSAVSCLWSGSEPSAAAGNVVPVAPAAPSPGVFPTSVPRLIIPTFTPEPTATLPFLSRVAATTVPPAAAFVPARTLQPVSPASDCVGRFRQLLVAYDGRDLFATETAIALSNQLLIDRPACGLSGWSPEFSLERVCTGSDVAGAALPDGLVRLRGDFNRREAGFTGRDADGNILVHLSRLPFEDESGCWFYSAEAMIWYWTLGSGLSGFDRVVLSGCDAELRTRLVQEEFISALVVVRVAESVRLDFPDSCGIPAWRQYPQLRPTDDCSLDSDTGMFEDGSFLINWNPEFAASDGAICWYWNFSEGLWSFSYPDGE